VVLISCGVLSCYHVAGERDRTTMTAELFDSDEDVSPLDSDEDAAFVADQKGAQVDAPPQRREEDFDVSSAEDIRDPFTGESSRDGMEGPAKILPGRLQEDAEHVEDHVQPLEDWEASERQEKGESFQTENPPAAELVDSAEDYSQPAPQPMFVRGGSSAHQEPGQDVDESDFQMDRVQEPELSMDERNDVPEHLQEGQFEANDSEQDGIAEQQNVVREQLSREQQQGEAEVDDSAQDLAQQVTPGQEESWGNYEDWKEDLADTGRGPNFYGNTFKAVDHVTSAVKRAGPAIGTTKREASSLLDHSNRYSQSLDKLSDGLKEFNVGVKNFREVTAKRHTRNTKHLSEQLAKGLQTGLAGFGPE